MKQYHSNAADRDAEEEGKDKQTDRSWSEKAGHKKMGEIYLPLRFDLKDKWS